MKVEYWKNQFIGLGVERRKDIKRQLSRLGVAVAGDEVTNRRKKEQVEIKKKENMKNYNLSF